MRSFHRLHYHLFWIWIVLPVLLSLMVVTTGTATMTLSPKDQSAALAKLLNMTSPSQRKKQRRTMQNQDTSSFSYSSEIIPCNQEIERLTLTQLQNTLNALIDAVVADGLENFFLKSLLVNNLQTGIMIMYVCSSCAEHYDFASTTTTAATVTNNAGSDANTNNVSLHFCDEAVFGYDQVFSGLVFLPMDTDAQHILPGFQKGHVDMRGARISLDDSPTLLWQPTTRTSDNGDVVIDEAVVETSLLWFQASLASTQASVFLAPHYMGYGASSPSSTTTDSSTTTGSIPKTFLVRKAYETAIMPLWYQTEQLVTSFSQGCSGLSKTIKVTGYSEGGYVAVAIADTMSKEIKTILPEDNGDDAIVGTIPVITDRMFDIVQVQAGGAPFRTSSESMLGIFELVNEGLLPTDAYLALAFLGASYSSTYPHVANYGILNQSMLHGDYIDSNNSTDGSFSREVILEALMTPDITSTEVDTILNELISTLSANTILGIFRQDFVDALQTFILQDVRDPCQTLSSEELMALNIDVLCRALVDNDLMIHVIDSPTASPLTFPIEVCHSPDDNFVTFENIPDMDRINESEFLSFVQSTGDHYEAAATCFLQVAQAASSFATIPVQEDDSTLMCDSIGGNDKPTMTPAPTPISSARSFAFFPLLIGIATLSMIL